VDPVIFGLGTDLLPVARMAAELRDRGFRDTVFTPGEIAYCESQRHPEQHYAARFAAKEAAMKAIGTGWNHGVAWRDVEVCRMPGGRPTITFHGKAAEFAARLGAKHIALSISHSEEYAIAQVILES
jgi:holo-[acyl-carrier protein] synthase